MRIFVSSFVYSATEMLRFLASFEPLKCVIFGMHKFVIDRFGWQLWLTGPFCYRFLLCGPFLLLSPVHRQGWPSPQFPDDAWHAATDGHGPIPELRPLLLCVPALSDCRPVQYVHQAEALHGRNWGWWQQWGTCCLFKLCCWRIRIFKVHAQCSTF